MAIGRLPAGMEPYEGWFARQQVMIWGRHPQNNYRRDVAPLKVGRVKRLTKTLVILEDDTRWERKTGATTNCSGNEYRTTPDDYIVPLKPDDRAEMNRVRKSLNVMANLAKLDITALSFEDLETLDRVAHQGLLDGKAKEP